MATVLYVVVETLRHLAVLTQPFMPASSGRMLNQLGVAEDARHLAALGPDGRLAPGTPLPKPARRFSRDLWRIELILETMDECADAG